MSVRPAYNREQLKITALLREQVGFQPFFHGEPKLPGVRKGDTLVQLIFAALTNNPNHFSNLIQVFSPYRYLVPSTLWLHHSPGSASRGKSTSVS